MRKQSVRSDFITRERLPIGQLFRLAKASGVLRLSKTYEEKGRGIYLKKDPSTLKYLRSAKGLKRLGASIEESTLKQMEALL